MAEIEPREYPPDVIEKIVEELEEGLSLSQICAGDPKLPTRRTINRWARADAELADRIMEARETGFQLRAERAVDAAKSATDATLGRLQFDAERWYLGKLSRAFAEKPVQIDARVLIGNDEAFATVADALNRASETIAGSGDRTSLVAPAGASGSADAAGD